MNTKEKKITEEFDVLEEKRTDDNSSTYLGYKIETKTTLSYSLVSIGLSLILCYIIFLLSRILLYISDTISIMFTKLGYFLVGSYIFLMILLFVLSLFKQPRYFFIDIRAKQITFEKVFYNMDFDLYKIILYCYGDFIILREFDRTSPLFVISSSFLFAPMEKVDKENLAVLINKNEGNFVCANKRCKQCCKLNSDLRLRRSLEDLRKNF